MKAAIYCRISLDKTGEGLGVSRQLEDCSALADQLGWEVVEVYTDNDISATSGKPRPAYHRMLAAIEAGEVEAVVAWHTDRLYRRLADLEHLIPIVERHKVAIRTCRAGEFDLSTPTGQMLARILGAVAQAEVAVKSDRWKRSVRQRREEGRPPRTRARCFGYDHDWQVIPEERDIVRDLAREFIEGVPIRRLAVQLNEAGVTTTLGNAWSEATVANLLRNPRIAGLSTLSRREFAGKDRDGKDTFRRVTSIVGAGTWEPLVDAETWERLVAAFATRPARRHSNARVALLPGLIFCGRCGTALITSSRLVSGRQRRNYRCPSRAADQSCGGVSGIADPIEEFVEGFAQARLDDPRVRARIEVLRASDCGAASALEAVDLEQRIRDLEARLADPGVPVDAILAAIDKSRQRLADLHGAIATTSAARTPLPERGGAWPTDLQRQRRLVELALEGRRVYLDPATQPGAFDIGRLRIE